MDETTIKKIIEMCALTAVMNKTADQRLLELMFMAQFDALSGNMPQDKDFATAYISSTKGGSKERIVIDICIPLDAAYLEDVEKSFELALRKLSRRIAAANVTETVSEAKSP